MPAPNLAFRRLPWGDVLAVGSAQPDVVAPASLYDVAGRSWRPTGSPAFPRSAAAVTVLTSGKVLVTGGASDDDTSRSAELYDPATGAWTPALSMRTPRSGHTATLLRDGRVLVLGGESEVHPEGAWDAEVFDPVEGTWLPFDLGMAGPALVDHTAVLLAGDDSPVLVTGANGGPAAFICVAGAVPPAKACRPTASMNVAHPGGTFTLLADGKVLAVGGRVDATSAEVFDPAPGSETWTPVTPMPRGRVDHAAVLLPSGRVLVAGGEALDGGVVPYTATADLYEPVADAWEPAPSLLWERGAFAMFAALADPGEEVLVVGGPRSTRGYLAPVEVVCLPPAPGARGARPAERARGPR